MSEPSVTNMDTDIIDHDLKLTAKQQAFKNHILKGENATRAYLKAYPGVSYNTAMVEGSKNLRKPKIQKAVRKRIAKALANAQVTDAEIIGAAARQARSSVADVLDETGNFSLEKAKKTGAIDFVKKIKTSHNPITGSVTTEVELLTNQDARKELANYLGIERNPTEPLVEAIERLGQAMPFLAPAMQDVTDNAGAIDVGEDGEVVPSEDVTI